MLLTIHIVDRQTNKGVESFNCFAPVTERVLFYSNEVFKTGLQEIYDNPNLFLSIKEYMREERDKIRKDKNFDTLEMFNQYINKVTNTSSVVSRHYFADSQYSFPTEEIYKLLQATGYFRREYEDLRREYEDLRRPFYNTKKLTDVMRYSQESHITRQFDHDTIKPERLTLDLIETTTKENDLVLIPFGGSGTECVCSMRLKRQWIAFENKKKYFDIALKRIHSEYEKTSLFNSLGGRQDRISA